MTESYPLPKVTIMIPTYNQEDYIEDAIKSALMQDYPNLEIIIGDDCSTDRTGKIAKRYISDRLKYFRNEKNLGRVGNYHHIAHDLATGEWAINLDGDDYFTNSTFISEAITKIVQCKNKGFHVIAYNYKKPIIDKLKRKYSTTIIDDNCILMKGKDYFINYYDILSFSHPSFIFNRIEGKNIGLYVKDALASDFHTFMRLICLGDILLDKRIISYWRNHGRNASFLESNDQYQQEISIYNDLAIYANSFFNAKDIIKWKAEMQKCAYRKKEDVYILNHKNFKSVVLLIKKIQISRRYLGFVKLYLKHLFES